MDLSMLVFRANGACFLLVFFSAEKTAQPISGSVFIMTQETPVAHIPGRAC